jgi:hypothetical protein
MHKDLQFIKTTIYDKHDCVFSDLKIYSESKEYGACSFTLNDFKIEHRRSKITPTKTGQFVTVWKRDIEGKTTPFSNVDEIDFVIITVKKEQQLGQFIFPKSILIKQGIFRSEIKVGKRGIRVYPPWESANNKQALTTQEWQSQYFFDVVEKDNIMPLKKLFF